MIEIKDITGQTILSLEIGKGCKRAFTLMKHDYILLKFSLAKSLAIRIGSYVELDDWGRFEVTDLYQPTRNAKTGGWDYELQLNATYWKWKNKIFKFAPDSGSNEASWSLTAGLDAQMGIFLRNLAALGYTHNGTPYTFAIDGTVANTAKAMTYDNQNLLNALFAMAETWETEVWVADSVINFGRCEFGDAVDFDISTNVESMTPENTRQTYATRLYAFGSERNIPTNYRPTGESAVINGIVQKRLMFPEGVPYVDARNGMSTEEAIETVKVFEDIYPRLSSAMSGVTTKQYDEEDEDGQPTGEKWDAYRYKDTSITFKEDYILEDSTLSIIFQTGSLAGMTFGVKFNPDGKSESDPDVQTWEIIRNEDYGRPLPDTTLRPKDGDTFVLTGWDSTKIAELGLVAAAEAELLVEARKSLAKMMQDPNSYTCKMVSASMFRDGVIALYSIGDRVNLVNDGIFPTGSRESRIIGYEYDLAQPFNSPTYIVGEKSAYSRLSELEGKVDTLTLAGQTFTGKGGGGVYIIRTSDKTAASDTNVYSALRSCREFLNRLTDDIALGRIGFAAGLDALALACFKDGAEFGTFIKSLYAGMGGGIDPQGNAEFESVRVRTYFEALELIVNRLSAIEGDQLLTEADTIESVDDLGDNCYGLHLRPKWDGYFTAQVQNNVLKGIINTLAQNAQTNAQDGTSLNQQGTDTAGNYYTSWMRVNSVNAAANYIEVTVYADDEVPSGRNFPPCAMMKIARWGNQTDETRQKCLYLSSTEGRIVKLAGVTKPIIDPANYGATFGELPEFLYDYFEQKGAPISKTQDYVYVRGLIAQEILHVDYMGKPIVTYVDHGEFCLGENYYFESTNPDTGVYETSDVWYRGCKWRCCHNLTATVPAWNNTHWAMIEGNPDFTVDFEDTDYLFDPDTFEVTLTIIARLYNIVITDDILDADVQWTRYSEDNNGNPRVASDNVWAIKHAGAGKSVHLTREDCDFNGYVPKVLRFTATVTLRDGMGEAAAVEQANLEL